MLNRRSLAIAATTAVAATVLRLTPAEAAISDETAVANAVEAFRKAMMANDRKQLDRMCTNALSYGHSSGKIQNKTEFLDGATNGQSTWKSITLSDQKITVVGRNAIARFIFTGESESQGKTNNVHFGVLMIWIKSGSNWRLLARQGYKI
jgi:hypothetical protein